MNKKFLILLITTVSVFSLKEAKSQPGDPGDDPDVPITGIEVLVGVGGALGLKKMLSKRKNQSAD
jgi:hypothetical protein